MNQNSAFGRLRPGPRVPHQPVRSSAAGGRQFATNWWARRWIEALEAFGWEDRLRRGRTYARAGQVRSIDVRAGRVDARVKGSRPQPYVVRIEVPALADETWERVVDALAAEARYAALLAGEMPPTIEDVFTRLGARLFPGPDEELVTSCSCPDWANPCKHIAAVHYVLGNEFDRDPFLLFQLRGRTREAIVAALRARRTAAVAHDGPPVENGAGQTETPLVAQLERFWTLGDEFAGLRFSIEPPRVPEAVLKRLGTPTPPDEGDQPEAELRRLYRTISEQAIRAAFDESGEL